MGVENFEVVTSLERAASCGEARGVITDVLQTSLKGRRQAVIRGGARDGGVHHPQNVLKIDISRILVETFSEESVVPLEQVIWLDLTTLLKKSHSAEAGNQETRT